jgi:hypothetical protein
MPCATPSSVEVAVSAAISEPFAGGTPAITASGSARTLACW